MCTEEKRTSCATALVVVQVNLRATNDEAKMKQVSSVRSVLALRLT